MGLSSPIRGNESSGNERAENRLRMLQKDLLSSLEHGAERREKGKTQDLNVPAPLRGLS